MEYRKVKRLLQPSVRSGITSYDDDDDRDLCSLGHSLNYPLSQVLYIIPILLVKSLRLSQFCKFMHLANVKVEFESYLFSHSNQAL